MEYSRISKINRKPASINRLIYSNKKKTVINAKLEQLNVIGNVLSVKDSTDDELLDLIDQFGLGSLLQHLSLEKKTGANIVTLILSLCLIRINGIVRKKSTDDNS